MELLLKNWVRKEVGIFIFAIRAKLFSSKKMATTDWRKDMKFKNFLLKDGQVIEQELEIHYEFTSSYKQYLGEYLGNVKRVETKLSEKVCQDQKILELFERRELCRNARLAPRPWNYPKF